MNRVCIFGDLKFPLGSASANYVYYLAKAIMSQGLDCIVISTPNAKESYMEEFNGIRFIPIHYTTKLSKHFGLNYMMGIDIVKKLKGLKIGSKDLLIAYSSNSDVLLRVLRYAKVNNVRTAACITERLDAEFFEKFKNGKKRFKNYLKATEEIIPKYDLVFPISTYLETFYKKLGAKTMLLPVLVDIDQIRPVKKSMSSIRYIFPASGVIKDSLSTMIESFLQLVQVVQKPIELHLTGISEEEFKQNYGFAEKEIGSHIFCHGWLTYKELIKLYRKTHFLFIARDINQVTLANFPSKVPEVMCYGVIPIASKVGDYTQYFLTDGKDSIIFDGCDCSACFKALKRTTELDNKEITIMSEQAIETVRTKLNLEYWGKKVLDCMTKLS